jgi:hypothetical protein
MVQGNVDLCYSLEIPYRVGMPPLRNLVRSVNIE